MPKPAIGVAVAPTPGWVKAIEPAALPSGSSEAASGGMIRVLLDRQVNVATASFYYHEARKIISETGVQNGAAVTVNFDPTYQKLTFHYIRVRHGDRVSDQGDPAQIQLFRRERDLERFIYDGDYTAQRELEDIRVGDVIEFAYTIDGANPVKAGKYSVVFSTEWSYPVRRVVTRFLYPPSRALQFRERNRKLHPVTTSSGGVIEWLADQESVPGRFVGDDTPVDYEPRGSLQVSEFKSWKELVEWVQPLFQVSPPASPELKAEVEELKAIADPEARIITALRFVQEEIRYLGIELGVGSHQPAAPGEVLRRRFGDCKDKSLLLATLLRASGIDAAPALVNTDYRSSVAERLPAPEDFDHAIVQVRWEKGDAFLDATRTGQRGPLSQIGVGDYRCALVLRDGNDRLTTYAPPPDSKRRREAKQSFRVPAPGGEGELDVVTTYYGVAAEKLRNSWAVGDPETIQKDYLQYYAARYPKAQVRAALRLEEVEGSNACRVSEFYRIPEFWGRDETTQKWTLDLYPTETSQAMGSAGSAQRDDPLALEYPIEVVEEIRAEMFEHWDLSALPITKTNAFFYYTEAAVSRGRELLISYSYRSLVDRVMPGEVSVYNAELTKIKDTLGYKLSYTAPIASGVVANLNNFNWKVAAVWLPTVLLALLASLLFALLSKRRVPLPPPTGGKVYPRLGGWLILVTLQMLARPTIALLTARSLFPTIFIRSTWLEFTTPGTATYHPAWAASLMFELFYSSILFVAGLLLIFLFFRKRAAWRWAYVVLLLGTVLGLGIDSLLTYDLPSAKNTLAATWRSAVQVIGGAAVWIPYCLISKRVRGTFRY
ncbi:MAG: DUF3857 domain-containing protein [Chthoniobacterales bacterium]